MIPVSKSIDTVQVIWLRSGNSIRYSHWVKAGDIAIQIENVLYKNCILIQILLVPRAQLKKPALGQIVAKRQTIT